MIIAVIRSTTGKRNKCYRELYTLTFKKCKVLRREAKTVTHMFRFCARDKILLFIVCTFHLIAFGMIFALDLGAFTRSITFPVPGWFTVKSLKVLLLTGLLLDSLT